MLLLMQINIIYNEDCITGLHKLPADSVDCCITSPPYFNLRDYGVAGQIGLEETPKRTSTGWSKYSAKCGEC